MFSVKQGHNYIANRTAILFDLDGTLIDSLPDIHAAAVSASEELGGQPCSQEDVRTWIGKGASTLVQHLMAGGVHSTDDTQHAVAVFMRHYHTQGAQLTVPYPRAHDVLGHARDAGIPIALVTNKPYDVTLTVLEQLHMGDYFDVVLGADSVPTPKPAPDMLTAAAQALGVALEGCLMVGDSNNDIDAARAARIPVIGLRGGYNHGAPIEDCSPDMVFDDIASLYQALVLA